MSKKNKPIIKGGLGWSPQTADSSESMHVHWFTSAGTDHECPICGESFDLPIEPVFVEVESEEDGKENSY